MWRNLDEQNKYLYCREGDLGTIICYQEGGIIYLCDQFLLSLTSDTGSSSSSLDTYLAAITNLCKAYQHVITIMQMSTS